MFENNPCIDCFNIPPFDSMPDAIGGVSGSRNPPNTEIIPETAIGQNFQIDTVNSGPKLVADPNDYLAPRSDIFITDGLRIKFRFSGQFATGFFNNGLENRIGQRYAFSNGSTAIVSEIGNLHGDFYCQSGVSNVLGQINIIDYQQTVSISRTSGGPLMVTVSMTSVVEFLVRVSPGVCEWQTSTITESATESFPLGNDECCAVRITSTHAQSTANVAAL